MSNWLDRTAITVGLAFVAGIAAAVIVFVIVLKATGGDDSNNAAQPTATTGASTPETATPAETASATTTPSPAAATATPGTYTSPDDALAGFVQTQLNTTYLGPCTQQAAQGVCSTELYRSDVLVAFFVGPPLSGGLGEAVITKGSDGNWSVEFLLAPQGVGALSVGIQAVVYGAGSCLNFHEEPRVAGKTLSCQADGAKARIVSGPVEADNITWWELDGLGWGSVDYLVPAAQ